MFYGDTWKIIYVFEINHPTELAESTQHTTVSGDSTFPVTGLTGFGVNMLERIHLSAHWFSGFVIIFGSIRGAFEHSMALAVGEASCLGEVEARLKSC